MSLVERRLKLKDTGHEKSECEKFEKDCDEIIAKCSKEVEIDKDYFKELLSESVEEMDEDEFLEEYEELLKDYIVS